MKEMRKSNNHSLIDNPPDWYWVRGLHDAQITSRLFLQFEYAASTQYRNCLELTIDSNNAMFDTSIKAIKFFNCKELTPDIAVESSWWVRDNVDRVDKKYVARIELLSQKHTFTYAIRFEHCEVLRE